MRVAFERAVHKYALARFLEQLQREDQIIEMATTYTQFRIVVSFLFQNGDPVTTSLDATSRFRLQYSTILGTFRPFSTQVR